MKPADAVLQEVWRVKDAAFKAAGHDAQRFVNELRERSAQLREGLHLRTLDVKSQAPRFLPKPPSQAE